MYSEFTQSFLLIFFAEIGDKSQMLAMAFATEYSLEKVLAGIFIGVLLNHGIAVALGNYISSLIPISTIQIFAGFLFVVFALWMFLAIVKYNFWQSKIQLPAPS